MGITDAHCQYHGNAFFVSNSLMHSLIYVYVIYPDFRILLNLQFIFFVAVTVTLFLLSRYIFVFDFMHMIIVKPHLSVHFFAKKCFNGLLFLLKITCKPQAPLHSNSTYFLTSI